jgi:formylglycine-generating enzyme required for sulfatase activity
MQRSNILILLFFSFTISVVAQSLPEMVFVHGGKFRMGSNFGVADENPVHEVVLSDFYIGKYEVTQAQWKWVMEQDTNKRYFEGCDNCPVERVNWYNVQEFIERLNKKTQSNYRLPTEAEWEYAARGGNLSRGLKFSGNNSVEKVAWIDGNSGKMTHPVGTKKPNELGIFDMSGNIFEWCSDWYSATYYQKASIKNPVGPESGIFRVIRGGSWFYGHSGLRVSARDKGNPDFRYGYVGFRLCRSATKDQ